MEKTPQDEQKKEIPSIKVVQQIFPGTLLEGRHSSLVIEENRESVLIKEVKITHQTPEGGKTSEWEMQISPLF